MAKNDSEPSDPGEPQPGEPPTLGAPASASRPSAWECQVFQSYLEHRIEAILARHLAAAKAEIVAELMGELHITDSK